MFRLSPLSALSSRIPQLFSWFFDPNQFVEPFLQKQKEKQANHCQYQVGLYVPPVYKPHEPKKIEFQG